MNVRSSSDQIDFIVEAWARESPAVDLTPFQVIGRVMRLAKIFGDAEARLLAPLGINRSEYFILCALARMGPPYALSPVRLGEALALTSGGLTKRLDALEAKGLVRRRADQHDRRSILVEITPAGAGLARDAFDRDMAEERRQLAGLPDADADALAKLLRDLLASLEAPAHPITRSSAGNAPDSSS